MPKPYLMKFLHTLFTLCAASSLCFAQPIYDASFEEFTEYFDFSDMETGYLFEQTGNIANLESNTGSPNNEISSGKFLSVYDVLAEMRLPQVTAAYTFPDFSVIENGMQTVAQSGQAIPVVVIAHRYDRFDPDPTPSNITYVQNNRLYRNHAQSASPFETKTFFASIPLLDGRAAGAIQFKRDDTYLFGNLAGQVATLEVDFDDGNGYQSFAPNQTRTINYSSAGNKFVNVRVRLVSNEVLFCRSEFVFEYPVLDNYSDEYDAVISLEHTPGDGSNEPDRGYVFLNCGAGNGGNSDLGAEDIRKPLLVIQGYDDGGFIPRNDFSKFFDKFRDAPKILSQGGMLVPDNVFQTSLEDLLESEDYDLIYLDFEDASYDLHHNSMVVESFLNELETIKAQNGSEEPTRILGLSMGGVLGRYTLLRMQDEGKATNVDKLVTWDSPHEGVNLPLAAQAALYDLAFTRTPGGELLKDRIKVNEKINCVPTGKVNYPLRAALEGLRSPAARQLSRSHVSTIIPSENDHPPGYFEFEGEIPHPSHTAFYNEMEGLGDLEDVEWVAVANGSDDNSGQPLTGDKIGSIDFNLNDDIPDSVFDLFFTDCSTTSPDDIIRVVNKFKTIARFFLDANFYIALYNQNSTSSLKLLYTLDIGAFLNLGVAQVTLIDESTHYRSRNMPNFDTGSAGTFKIDVSDFLGASGIPGLLEIYPNVLGFTPTFSALDLPISTMGTPVGQAYNNPSAAGSRADVIFASEFDLNDNRNQLHVVLTPGISNIFISELLTPESQDQDLQGTISGLFNAGSRANFTPSSNTPFISSIDHIESNTVVSNGGALWINRNGGVGYTNDPNSVNSNFHFRIDESTCDDVPTTVTIATGAELLVGHWNTYHNTATLSIGDNATLRIDGHAEVARNSRIVIADGGTLHLTASGHMETYEDTEIVVREGGKLILDEGAELRLWSGQSANGTALIDVYGTLEVNGKPDMDGNGYFHFHPDSEITSATGTADLELSFTLSNGDRNRTMIMERVVVEDIDLRLAGGKIINPVGAGRGLFTTNVNLILEDATWAKGMGIEMNGGSLELLAVDWKEYGIEGVEATGLRSVLIEGGHIYDLDRAFDFSDMGAESFIRISELTSMNCKSSLFVSDCPSLQIGYSEFHGQQGHVTGISLQQVPEVQIFDSQFHNYYGATDYSAAVRLQDVRFFRVFDSEFYNNRTAIYAPAGSNGALNHTNVLLGPGTVVRNNQIGILIGQGGTGEDGFNYGLVSMFCAALTDNKEAGIRGRDALLSIDAFMGNYTGEQEARTNTFSTGGESGLLFDICYEQFDVENVIAFGNFWGPNGTPPSPASYQLRSDCDVSTSDIALLTNQHVNGPAEECPITVFEPEPEEDYPVPNENFTDIEDEVDCIVVIGNEERLVHKQYNEAWNKLSLEETEAAYTTLLPIAMLNDTEIDNASAGDAPNQQVVSVTTQHAKDRCRNYRDVARVFVNPEEAKKGFRTQRGYTDTELFDGYWTDAARGETVFGDLQLELAPNPTDDLFYLTTYRDGTAEYICYDRLGQEVQRGSFERTTKIRTHDWLPGVYTVEVRYAERRPVVKRVVVNR